MMKFIAQTGAHEVSQQEAKQMINDKKNPLQKLVRVLGDTFYPDSSGNCSCRSSDGY